MSTATATGARTARATGTNAPTMTARIGKKASRTRPRTSTPMTRIRPAMFAATSAPSRRPPTSTATATGARTARATGTNARILTARIGKKASRTKPRTSIPMTRIRPAMFAATSAPSRRPPMSTATAIGARTAQATGTNARILNARIGKKASRTKPRTSTQMTRIRPAMFAATSAPSRRPPTSTATATGARTARATGTNARMLTARIGTRASRTRPRTSTPMTRIRPAMFAATSAPSRLLHPPSSSSPLTATAVRAAWSRSPLKKAAGMFFPPAALPRLLVRNSRRGRSAALNTMRATATSCSETPRSRLCGRIPQ